MQKLNELKEAFYPQYGTPGSRDMDVTARRKVIDENIEAVAEAFRELEQRAEAAEAERSALQDGFAEAIRHKDRLADELNELAKQKPVGTVSIAMDWSTHRNVATVNMRHDLVVSEMKDGDELFTRPAPAADRVPEGWKQVPVEPTEEMIAAGDQFMDGLSRLSDAYDAMLTAAPEVE